MPEQVTEMMAIPAVRAIVIVFVSIVAAWVSEIVIRRTVMVAATKTKTELDDFIVTTLRQPIFLSVLFYGLSWATASLTPQATVRFVVFGVLKSLAILVWALAGMRIGREVLATLSRRATAKSIVQPRTLPLFSILLKIAVVGLGIYFGFLVWHIDVTAWIASAGIMGIAVGFAAKDTLSNLFSGIFIVADAPYQVGDFIVLDDGMRGKVTAIGMRSTRILTNSGVEITVPNATIAGGKIINEAGGPFIRQRISVVVEAAYGSDIDRVHQVLSHVPQEIEDIAGFPSPQVRFTAFGASGLVHELQVWIEEPAVKGRVMHQLHTKIYKDFATAGIEIPYAKQDVYIKEIPRGAFSRAA